MARKTNTQTSGAGAKDASVEKKLSGRVIIVTGPEGGRWRAGRQFGSVPTEIPVEEFGEGEEADAKIKVLLDDPKLSVKPGEASKPETSDEE